MKIEKIRNNHKKEIIIGTILTVVIGGALTFRLTHSKYRVTQSIDLGSGVINYKVPDFKIMAMYKNDGSGDVSIDSMPTSGYAINEEKTYCETSTGNQVKGKIKTVNGIHGISGLNKGDKCYLYFVKLPTVSETILTNLGTNIKTSIPTFNNGATSDEGVYSTSDGMYGGTTYYWRGAVTNNYVKFAGFCWRIIRINGDGSLRLIYDGSTCHANGTSTADSIAVKSQAYNSSCDQSNYVGWTYSGTSQRTMGGTSSNAKSQTESWYNSNLKSNEGKIADGKFCNDRDAGSGYSWTINGSDFYYAGYTRLYQNYNPTFSCPTGDAYTLKVGAITADEVMYAGGTKQSNTASCYLYNGQNYWTITPYNWNGSSNMFFVGSGGAFGMASINSSIPIRPVINLKSDITFSSGDGTQNLPYVVS